MISNLLYPIIIRTHFIRIIRLNLPIKMKTLLQHIQSQVRIFTSSQQLTPFTRLANSDEFANKRQHSWPNFNSGPRPNVLATVYCTRGFQVLAKNHSLSKNKL